MTPHPSVNIVEAARAAAQTNPEKIAYRFIEPEGEQTLSYAQLIAWVDNLAATLSDQDLAGQNATALLVLPAGLEFIATFLACLSAQVLVVPVPAPRNARQVAALSAIAQSAKPRIILTQGTLMERWSPWFDAAPMLRDIPWFDIDDVPRSMPVTEALPSAFRQDVAYLQYTSGSTSAPKGARISHANLAANLTDITAAFRIDGHSVICSWLPHFHDMGLVGGILTPLYNGASCILMSPLTFLTRPRIWFETITRYKVDISGGPNFAYALCQSRIKPDDLTGLDLSNWKLAFSGAEPVQASSLTGFADAFAGCGFNADALFPCYGLAEATLFVSGRLQGIQGALTLNTAALAANKAIPAAQEDSPTAGISMVSCGPWRGTTDVQIVQADCLPAPAGHVGEIWIAGDGVSDGYHDNPKATAVTFGHTLPGRSERYLRTGDMGFVHNGELFVVGRLKDVIVVGGKNFHASDLEQTARQQSSHIQDAALVAIGVPSDQGTEEIHLLIERMRKHYDDEESLATRIIQAIVEQFDVAVMKVHFTKHGALPRTTSGKLKRVECKAAYLEGAL